MSAQTDFSTSLCLGLEKLLLILFFVRSTLSEETFLNSATFKTWVLEIFSQIFESKVGYFVSNLKGPLWSRFAYGDDTATVVGDRGHAADGVPVVLVSLGTAHYPVTPRTTLLPIRTQRRRVTRKSHRNDFSEVSNGRRRGPHKRSGQKYKVKRCESTQFTHFLFSDSNLSFISRG